MTRKLFISLSFVFLFFASINIVSCSKPDVVTPAATDPCAGKTIVVAATTTPASSSTATNGSISATATGSTGFSYNINNGTFQATGNFTALAAGTYTIIAKDANGCLSPSANITVSTTSCPTIALSFTSSSSDKCSNTGSITATASGSTGLMFNLNNGTYQTSNIFSGLPTGTYTLTVKDVNNCTNTITAQVTLAPSGPLFTNVKTIMMANCAISGCHAGSSPQNGLNFSIDCTIVSQSARIKARAVDGNPSIMPASGAISASDKQKIVDWINAGGKYSN